MQKSKHIFIIALGIAAIVLFGAILLLKNQVSEISLNEFRNLPIQNAKMQSDAQYFYVNIDGKNYRILKELLDVKEFPNLKIEAKSSISALELISIIVLILFGIFLALNISNNYKSRKAAPKPLEQNPSKTIAQNASISNIKFENIAGINEVKEDLLEIIDYLKNPAKYKKLGIRLPKGVLLIGPPGVGKTMIAKAIANEARVPFFYQSGSSFAQIYVGVGAKRVQELFYSAKAHAPSIIFIDEIDAVGKSRGGNRNDEREATLNQLLTEMDGFVDSSDVIVIGATNQAKMLDSALLRAGRFDRRIYIDLPDLNEREHILKLYLEGKNHSVDTKEIAKHCTGFSGAAINSLVNEASLNALRNNREKIENIDFFISHNKLTSGLKTRFNMNESEREILAFYQASKALCAYWCDFEFDKISLLNQNLNDIFGDKKILSKSDLLNRIKVALSGSVALKMKFEPSTICQNDIAIAKQIALDMSKNYAMAERILAGENDAEEILESAIGELKSFFFNAKTALDSIKNQLLANEKISKDEIREISKDMLESI